MQDAPQVSRVGDSLGLGVDKTHEARKRGIMTELAQGLFRDRYSAAREIARGGMALVLEGHHLVTGRRVAIKVVDRPREPKLLARLEREARLLGTLQHPGLLDALDARIEPESGYLVTPLLDGRPLDGILTARGRLDHHEVLAIVMQLAETLSYVHDKGVVHRDLKPANVFITYDGVTDRAKLIDFGLAGSTGASVSERLTQEGSLLGTLAYVAPEQLTNPEQVDARSDQYALGMLAYEALTGDVLPIHDRMRSPPSASALRQRTEAPDALLTAISRLLEPDPSRRYGSARELLRELGADSRPLSLLVSRVDATVHPTAPEAARRHRRAPYVTPCRLKLPHATLDGRTENISESGLLFYSPSDGAELATDDRVLVRFATPVTGGLAEVAATVRWSRKTPRAHVTGLEFDFVTDALRAEVTTYLGFFAAAESAHAM